MSFGGRTAIQKAIGSHSPHRSQTKEGSLSFAASSGGVSFWYKTLRRTLDRFLPAPINQRHLSETSTNPTMRHSFLKSVFDPNNYKTYHAHCHCGAIRYDAKVSPPIEDDHEVVTCNCSYLPFESCSKMLTYAGAMCIRTGAWNVYVPAETVTFARGEEKLKVTSPPPHPLPPTFFLTKVPRATPISTSPATSAPTAGRR